MNLIKALIFLTLFPFVLYNIVCRRTRSNATICEVIKVNVSGHCYCCICSHAICLVLMTFHSHCHTHLTFIGPMQKQQLLINTRLISYGWRLCMRSYVGNVKSNGWSFFLFQSFIKTISTCIGQLVDLTLRLNCFTLLRRWIHFQCPHSNQH